MRRPHSALGAPDAPYRPGWSMTIASRASCRKPRPTHGRQPWPRRRARGPAAPPALAQHRSTHKACHYSSNFLTIHPHNGILPFLLIKPVDSDLGLDSNGLMRFVPRAEAEAWTAAPPGRDGGPEAPQHHQHLPSTAALTRHNVIREVFY